MNNESNNKKTGLIILVAIVLVVLAGGGYYGFVYKPAEEAKEKARKELAAQKAAAAEKKKQQQRATKKKADFDELIKKGDQEFEEESWEAAQYSYSQAISLFPKQQYPQDRLTLVNERLEVLASQSELGTVEVLSSATGRFYLVVSSSIDDDLAMDYGNKMAQEGNDVKIIEPQGEKGFYRTSLKDYATLDEAVTASTSFDTTGENDFWILKY